jgi:hypothetical protein
VRGRARAIAAALVVAIGLTPRELPAQIWSGSAPRDTVRIRPELRLDYLGARAQALHAGLGVSLPAGRYARVGLAAGAGPGWGDAASPSARVDAVVRFLLDPFRRSRLGFSAGGGLSARYDEDLRGVALLFAEVEGPGRRGWIPFGALGLGGGVRLSAGLRRAATAGR